MFTFTRTHHSEEKTGLGRDTYDVYRDKQARMVVTHYSAARGGCLYIGEVIIRDDNTLRSFSFSTTSAPWGEIGHHVAKAYAERHLDKLA